MTKTNMKKMIALTASLVVLGGVASAQPLYASGANEDAFLASLYQQIDAAQEKTQTIVLAKAESTVVRRLAMRAYLPSPQPNLNRFVLAHLEP
jgi:hypothetical protein